jgi:hypothetical protein
MKANMSKRNIPTMIMDTLTSSYTPAVVTAGTLAIMFASASLKAEEGEAEVISTAYNPVIELAMKNMMSSGTVNENALMVLTLSKNLSEGKFKAEFRCSASNAIEARAKEISAELLEQEEPNLNLVIGVSEAGKQAEAFSYLNNCQKAP